MSKKYFLGSVGRAEAFRVQADGTLKLAFVSKTLTTSGLTISTTKDDIRAGEGAPIQFSFYHDPSVEINLTDVVFKTEYIEAQLGAEFKSENAQSYQTANVSFNGDGTATLDASYPEILPVPFPCNAADKRLVWVAPKGSDEWRIATASVGSGTEYRTITLAGASGAYCARYLGENSAARIAEITSTIIPQELFLVITAPIFAGDACSASKGKAAGYIQFEVPRFSLNGSQEFSMEMSSNQTMSLAGVALASDATDCSTGAGKLLRIIEVVTDRNYFDEVVSLLVDEDCLKVGLKPDVYGELSNGGLIKMDNKDLVYKTGSNAFARMTDDFVWPTTSSATTYNLNIATARTGTPIVTKLANDETVTVAVS